MRSSLFASKRPDEMVSLMDLPKCRICQERHRLGPCPSTQSKLSGGGERPAGKERGTARTSVELPTPTSRASAKAEMSSPVSSPARSTKKEKPVAKKKAKAKKSAPRIRASQKTAERDPSVMPGWGGAGTRRGRPPAADADKSAEKLKPWKKLKISRRTWYRHRAKAAKPK